MKHKIIKRFTQDLKRYQSTPLEESFTDEAFRIIGCSLKKEGLERYLIKGTKMIGQTNYVEFEISIKPYFLEYFQDIHTVLTGKIKTDYSKHSLNESKKILKILAEYSPENENI